MDENIRKTEHAISTLKDTRGDLEAIYLMLNSIELPNHKGNFR